QDVLPLETLPSAVPLDHHVGDLVAAFVGGEPAHALQAFPTPPDEVTFLAFTRVDDPVLAMPAKRTGHNPKPEEDPSMCLKLRHLMPSWKAITNPRGTMTPKVITHSTKA